MSFNHLTDITNMYVWWVYILLKASSWVALLACYFMNFTRNLCCSKGIRNYPNNSFLLTLNTIVPSLLIWLILTSTIFWSIFQVHFVLWLSYHILPIIKTTLTIYFIYHITLKNMILVQIGFWDVFPTNRLFHKRYVVHLGRQQLHDLSFQDIHIFHNHLAELHVTVLF